MMPVWWEDDAPARKRVRCARCGGWFEAEIDPGTGRQRRIFCGSCAGQKVLFPKSWLRKRGGR